MHMKSAGLQVREGTPISQGHPNDFPSPRKEAAIDPALIGKMKDDIQPQKYYAVLPNQFDVEIDPNPVLDKIRRINKNFIS